jgi:hypothetical protein
MSAADDLALAGRVLLVVDADLPPATREACADVAAALADRTGVPVTVAEVWIDGIDRVRPALTGPDAARVREFAPAARGDRALPMAAAPFLWRDDGRPDWASMWTTFCELALYGGPPHRGPDSALRSPAGSDPAVVSATDDEMLVEMRRGIWETTGLYAEPAAPGWLAVTCDSPKMAAWLCAAIILENVEARLDEDRLLLPAGAGYRLEDEVKSIVTVVAKTHHYWQAHVVPGNGNASDGE